MTATILLLVGLGLLAVVASFAGGIVMLTGTSCSPSSSCLEWVVVGTAVAVLAPPVCWVVALAGSIVTMVRRRRAVWIPLVAVLAWVGLVAVALLLAGIGTGIDTGIGTGRGTGT